ncbi:MAG TPA: L,D-transpeptidase [Chloroflexi bacterium]|nr:L,D-transpeptidase [Chloroflexota bacterium]
MRHKRSQGTLPRRAALKAGALAAAALAGGRRVRPARAQDDEPFDPGGRVRIDYDETISFNELYGYPPMLGRVEGWVVRVVAEAGDYYNVIDWVRYDEVLPIYAAVHAESPFPHNDVWFDIGRGYVHSSMVVPVREEFQQPEPVIGDGFWGEITVPTSWQHWEPKLRSQRYFDLAYGCVFRVIDRADEPDGRAWYRILDDISPSSSWWVQATHVRRVQPGEFNPISPDVPPEGKRIEVNIGEQLLTCYEGETPVFTTRISSGTYFRDNEGNLHQFNTPYGEHIVIRKMPSRHMIGGEEIDDYYNLPGVPWCTFFTHRGAAIHGTYWHNDFGRPRSHGCVNVTNDAAKWVYRWTNPFAGYEDANRRTASEEREIATRIIVTR